MRYLVVVLVVVLVVAGIAVGVAGVVAGEADDSPGLQGLGVLLTLGSVALAVRSVQRTRKARERSQAPRRQAGLS